MTGSTMNIDRMAPCLMSLNEGNGALNGTMVDIMGDGGVSVSEWVDDE